MVTVPGCEKTVTDCVWRIACHVTQEVRPLSFIRSNLCHPSVLRVADAWHWDNCGAGHDNGSQSVIHANSFRLKNWHLYDWSATENTFSKKLLAFFIKESESDLFDWVAQVGHWVMQGWHDVHVGMHPYVRIALNYHFSYLLYIIVFYCFLDSCV